MTDMTPYYKHIIRGMRLNLPPEGGIPWKVKQIAYKIDPECWVSYSGKARAFKQQMDVRRTAALDKAAEIYNREQEKFMGNDEAGSLGAILRDLLNRGTAVCGVEIVGATNDADSVNDAHRKAQQAASLINGVHTVEVCFRHELQPNRGYTHLPNKRYSYMTTDNTIKKGDVVVVDSPTTSYTCVEVVAVHKNTKQPNASKWVVQKVNDTAYKNDIEMRKRIKQLEQQIGERAETLRRKFEINDLAKHDAVLAQFVTELELLKRRCPDLRGQ